MVHSGRQFGGTPMYVGEQEQLGTPLTSLHCEYGPHGEGMHGLRGGSSCGGRGATNYNNDLIFLTFSFATDVFPSM